MATAEKTTITYNGSTLATLEAGQTATIKTANTEVDYDIVVKAGTLESGAKIAEGTFLGSSGGYICENAKRISGLDFQPKRLILFADVTDECGVLFMDTETDLYTAYYYVTDEDDDSSTFYVYSRKMSNFGISVDFYSDGFQISADDEGGDSEISWCYGAIYHYIAIG